MLKIYSNDVAGDNRIGEKSSGGCRRDFTYLLANQKCKRKKIHIASSNLK